MYGTNIAVVEVTMDALMQLDRQMGKHTFVYSTEVGFLAGAAYHLGAV